MKFILLEGSNLNFFYVKLVLPENPHSMSNIDEIPQSWRHKHWGINA
jgi:hypothetical protein